MAGMLGRDTRVRATLIGLHCGALVLLAATLLAALVAVDLVLGDERPAAAQTGNAKWQEPARTR